MEKTEDRKHSCREGNERDALRKMKGTQRHEKTPRGEIFFPEMEEYLDLSISSLDIECLLVFQKV